MSDELIKVEHLKQYFPAGGLGKRKKYVKAVDDVSFTIHRGETLGLVGESGCGKTTTGRTLLRLYEPTEGRITYDNQVIFAIQSENLSNLCVKIFYVIAIPLLPEATEVIQILSDLRCCYLHNL